MTDRGPQMSLSEALRFAWRVCDKARLAVLLGFVVAGVVYALALAVAIFSPEPQRGMLVLAGFAALAIGLLGIAWHQFE